MSKESEGKPVEAYVVFTCPYCGRTVSIENIHIVINVHVHLQQPPSTTATTQTQQVEVSKQKLIDTKKLIYRSLERKFGSERVASLLTVLNFRDEGETYRVEITSSLDPEYYRYMVWLLTKKLNGEKLDDKGRIFRIPKSVPMTSLKSTGRST